MNWLNSLNLVKVQSQKLKEDKNLNHGNGYPSSPLLKYIPPPPPINSYPYFMTFFPLNKGRVQTVTKQKLREI